MWALRVGRSVSLIVLLVGLSACGTDAEGATTAPSRGLTLEQAERLSAVLSDNLEAQGARFVVSASFDNGDRIVVSGEVNWLDHTGHATVTMSTAGPGPVEVFWNERVMVERWPVLDGRLTDAGDPIAPYVWRPADPSGRQVDNLVAIIAALASTQRDNPLLIQQRPNAMDLGDQRVGDVLVERLSYSEDSEFWLAQDDGRLLRYLLTTPGRTVTVDLVELAPQTVVGPAEDQVTAISEFSALYEQVRLGH